MSESKKTAVKGGKKKTELSVAVQSQATASVADEQAVPPTTEQAVPAEPVSSPSADDTMASTEQMNATAKESVAVLAEPTPASSALAAAVQAALDAHKQALSVPPPARSGKANVSRSTVENPVKLVHSIAASMHATDPNVTRKSIIAACEQVGIATHTAKTQYQIWRTAARNDAAAAARSQVVSVPPAAAVARTEPKLVALRPEKPKQ